MSAETAIKSHSKTKGLPKEKERKTSQSSTAVERLKVVVRRLPPNLPEDVFWQSVQPWVTDETVIWKNFHPGKLRKKLNKENLPSRAYVAFKRDDQLAAFAREYDGHLFRDKAGNESQAVVEFALYQKVPSDKKKADARIGTIEKDEDYISFLELLKSASANPEPPSMEALIVAAQSPPPPKTTPLLEALKAERTAHRDKEVILRNHAHHKDGTVLPTIVKKEEQKKKGAAPDQPQLSKKAAKRAAAAAQRAAAQAQAAAAVVALATQGGSSKNAGTSESAPALAKHVTPKAPRAMREQQARQQAASAAGVATQNNANAGETATITASSTDLASAPASPQPGQRRTRPVIAAASRQFEAALSGAGVSVGGERKPRRDRDKDKERSRVKQAGGPPVSAPPANVPEENDPGPQRMDNLDPGTSGGNLELSPTSPKPKITGILQRPDLIPITILQRDEQNSGDAAPVKPAPAAGAPEAGVVRGFGRRGRGRGRGGRRGGT